MIAAAVREYGGLDILVNNAGFSHRMMPLWELPEEDYDRVFAVNITGSRWRSLPTRSASTR